MTAEPLLELSDERDRWERFLLDCERAAYAAGFADGRAAERIEADRAWSARPPRAAELLPGVAEARRWELRGEPRTRTTFGRLHPADYQGRESAA